MVLGIYTTHDLHVNFPGYCRCFQLGEVAEARPAMRASPSLVACGKNATVKCYSNVKERSHEKILLDTKKGLTGYSGQG
jgi:hypothetical protein